MSGGSTFRDFGILPEQVQPPVGIVRAFFSGGRVAGQYLGSGLVAAIGFALALTFGMTLPLQMGMLALLATVLMFALFVYGATKHDYRWIELEGDTLRARHLYLFSAVKRSIVDIDRIRTIVYAGHSVEVMVVQYWLGRVRGVEVTFRDGRTPLRILRADPAMTNAQQLIEAIIYRWSQVAGLDTEFRTLDGSKLVREIRRKDVKPRQPLRSDWKIVVGCLMALAWMFGIILSYLSASAQETLDLGSTPRKR